MDTLREDQMKKLLQAGLMSLAMTIPAAAEEWFISHLGPEPCVPLADIDITNPYNRLYYRGGQLHTPVDLQNWLLSIGEKVQHYEERTNGINSMVTFQVSSPNNSGYVKVVQVFNDQDVCRVFMEMIGE
jgi:hypothetical protein